ncbi:MAG: DMT family transporter [Alphaproteobacteria bacterium]|nr:DMT family transporter [Alphaproteobacteria bacterium]
MLLAVFAILMFAGIDVGSKLLGSRMPVIQIIWLRFVFFIPLAVLLAYRPGGGVQWRSRRPWLQVVRVLILVVEMWFFIAAFAAMPLADVHAIGAIAPLLVTALSVPFLGERVGWRRWAAVGVGFLGMMVILRPGFTAIGLATIYAVVGASLWAVYQIVLRVIGRIDSAETTALWTTLVGAAATSLVGPVFWTPPDAAGWLILVAVTLLGGFGHMVYSRAFTLAPASTLQPFTYLLLVFATLFGWLIFGDLPDVVTMMGAALIVASGLYTFHRERVRAAQRGG